MLVNSVFLRRCRQALALLVIGVIGSVAAAQASAPQPPAGLNAVDHPFDVGDSVDLTWVLSPDDTGEIGGPIAAYKVYRSMTEKEIEKDDEERLAKAIGAARKKAASDMLEAAGLDLDRFEEASDDLKTRIRAARDAAAAAAKTAMEAELAAEPTPRYQFVSNTLAGENEYKVDKLARGTEYWFKVEAFGANALTSAPAVTAAPVAPVRQWFDGSRLWLLIITLLLCGSVIGWILAARAGKPIRVRKIAGLEAVDEAVGRATEMGRSCLFVPGIQDMNDIQTIAGITVLARVAKTAAEYDAKVEVPTSRSLVMTTCRETVQASFLAAGRPDAFNEDLIYYVTDEQFGYVAYLSGMMVREKPAACFYMGSFFAESLILAETGNSIGAIQVAGTAQPAQLPFFVAACDYTLIGEEFFAASAYLSGSAEELGSLKGQDVGKLIVAIMMLAGILAATFGLDGVVDFIRGTMLT